MVVRLVTGGTFVVVVPHTAPPSRRLIPSVVLADIESSESSCTTFHVSVQCQSRPQE